MPEAQPLRPHDPARLGRYELLGRLGAGAQGTVFLAEGAGGERVAVKLLQVQFDDDATARARFVREAEAAKQVARFCTAQLLDAEVAGDTPYLVSEYVPGEALNRAVARDGPLAGGALDRLAVSTASALTAIHRAGVVHRDLKPHNVLLGPDGPRVIDFGLSRVLDAASAVSSRAVGTPAYMAPEQVSGGSVGAAADVFGWGATMTFAATGRPPFGSDSIPAVMYRVLHHDPDLGGLDGELGALVAAALAKDPARRPTAAQLLLLLVGHDDAFDVAAASEGSTASGTEGGTEGIVDGVPAGAAALPAEPAAGDAGGGDTLPPASTEPDGGGPGQRRGKRSRGRRLGYGAVAGAAAAVVAAAAGAGGYALLDRPGGGPAASSPDRGGVTATAPAPSRSSSGPPTTEPSRPRPGGSTPAGAPSRPGSGQGTRPGQGGGGDGPPPSSDPPPAPVVLGSPSPARYCGARDRDAEFRIRDWYCVPRGGGIGVDTKISMTAVCASQYRPDAEARLRGDAADPGDWECYVLR